MKKYLLKGKEYLTKKLEQLQIQTQSLDYVFQQVPYRLKKPLKILQNDIDLESNEQYNLYCRSYPIYLVSNYLLQKYQLLLSADSQPIQYILPYKNTQKISIPQFDQQLQKKALYLRQIVEQYDQGYNKIDDAIICMNVIHFHHKRGTQVQYQYPNTNQIKQIQNLIIHHAMPDSSHNKNQDYNFFNFICNLYGKQRMLFGVSYFKQIKTTQEMKAQNQQITRSYLQKAVTVISTLPIFGYLKLRLATTTKLFFEDFNNFHIIQMAFHDINSHITQSWPTMTINQLYIGTDLRTIIQHFGISQFYQIWKAILYQKRIVVFAHSSSSASSFIISLLSLFPGSSTFGIYSKPISKYMQSLREYGLPLRIFSSQNFLLMSFHVQDFHLLSRFKNTNEGNFLIGTTNRLLKEQADKYNIQMIVNLQTCTVEKKKARVAYESKSKIQKHFIAELQQFMIETKNSSRGSTQDSLRNHFHQFLKRELVQIMRCIKLFKKFEDDCSKYEENMKLKIPGKIQKDKQYQSITQQSEHTYKAELGQYPPVIPPQILIFPFSTLLLNKSFRYFLQFHNPQLPSLLNKEIIPSILIQNYNYRLYLNKNEFVNYDWKQKKLSFGRGSYYNFQGKQIKFISNEKDILETKSIYIGFIQSNRYEKSGYYMDNYQIYHGDFRSSVKFGYGKLINQLGQYIGHFENNLFHGSGQLIGNPVLQENNQEIYVGEFFQGFRHGKGKSQSDHTSFDGQWQYDLPHGSGTLKINDDSYIGVFSKGNIDEKHEVTIRYQNGSIYKGMIKNRLPHGKGLLVDETGTVVSAIFQEGKLIQKIQNTQNKQQKTQTNGQAKKQERNTQKQQPEIKESKDGENIKKDIQLEEKKVEQKQSNKQTIVIQKDTTQQKQKKNQIEKIGNVDIQSAKKEQKKQQNKE